jgi:putative PEP-CTERM system histidine kinase
MQLIFYTQVLLHRTLDMSLVGARVAAIVFGLLLFFFARLRRGRPVRLSLSRTAAFHSVLLLVVSTYLLFVGFAGEGVRYLGPMFSRAVVLSFFLFGGVALFILILSESLRRKIKVFLHKHFYQQKYDYRLLWVAMTSRLGGVRDAGSLYSAIVDIYCQTFAVQSGALYLNRNGQGWLSVVTDNSEANMPERIELNGSLAMFLHKQEWVFNLRVNADEISSTDSQQLKKHDAQFVVPLFFDQELGGVVVLGRQINTSESFIYEDYDLMKIFARQAAAVLFNERLSYQLAIHTEMAAVGKVSAFVMHDLKNLGSNLSLVVENAQDLIHDSRFQQDMLKTLTNTVGRMNGLIGRLKNVGESNSLSCESYNLKQLVRETVDEIDSADVTCSGTDVDAVVDRSEIGKVITNLVLNGIEASSGEGNVQIETASEGGPLLVCRDEGCGMSDEFIASSLFRPFETTKKKGMGIGLYQCRQIVEAHGGRIEVASTIGKGSEFRVYLPPTVSTEVLSDG